MNGDVWGSGGTSALACPYCLWQISGGGANDVRRCSACGTAYHADCYQENGGCGTFGCPDWTARQGGAPVPAPAVATTPRVGPAYRSGGSLPGSQTVEANSGATFAGARPDAASYPGASPPSRFDSFCNQCGEALRPVDRFCGYCGRLRNSEERT
jgi:hypothetical protein